MLSISAADIQSCTRLTLSRNGSLLQDIRDFAKANKPIYAECGGLMYLAERLTTIEGQSYPMAGILPVAVEMTKVVGSFRIRRCGVRARLPAWEKGNAGSRAQLSLLPHRRSRSFTLRLSRSLLTFRSKRSRKASSVGSVLGSYIHLHFRSNPSLVSSFLRQAGSARRLAEAQ